MSKFEKAKDRIRLMPNDYTYSEAKYLLRKMGFEEKLKGKTSGSRVMFYRDFDGISILLHKPHPGDEMKKYAVVQLVTKLRETGDL